MNAFGAQDIAVAAVAALALGWLVRRSLRRRRAKGCACDGCPVAEAAIRRAAAQAPSAPAGDESLVTIEGLSQGRS